MEIAKHSPGPWIALNRKNPEGHNVGIFGSDDTQVAWIHVCGKVTQANALLISAAPEMLQALKELLKRPYDYMTNEDWLLIGNAVNKAEGREP